MEVVDVGSIPASIVIGRLLEGDNLRRLARGHGAACFALPGILHSRAFYEALIERAAAIDATTRQHIAFVVFYGDRTRVLHRVEGYRPHLERYRLEGISTSADRGRVHDGIYDLDFSANLAQIFRYTPDRVDRRHFHDSMETCTSALLDRFALSHRVEPALLFVDPERPAQTCVVKLDPSEPVRSLLADVLTPLSEAFRELSSYWSTRDELKWLLQRIAEAQAKQAEWPARSSKLASEIERLELEQRKHNSADAAELATLKILLEKFSGDWRDADLRLAELRESAMFRHELELMATYRKNYAELSELLAGMPVASDDHRTADRRSKLEKSRSRARSRRLNRLATLRDQLRARFQATTRRSESRQQRMVALRREVDSARREFDQAASLLATSDADKLTADGARLAEWEARLRDLGYSDDVLIASPPSAFAVVETLNRTGGFSMQKPTEGADRERHRILFLASNPQSTSRLDLEEELRSVDTELRSVRFRDAIELKIGFAVRPDDLIRLLRQERPTIVHFSGHASSEGIVLRSDSGDQVSVSGQALERVFRDRGVQLVVLNACFTGHQAKLLGNVVSAVIGTTSSVGDEAARRFSTAFYRTLGDGHSLRDAFKDGGDAVAVHDLNDVFLAHGNMDVRLCGREPP